MTVESAGVSDVTRAWVIHPEILADKDRRAAAPALAEAVALAAALPGITVLGSEIARLPKTQPGQLFGSGKVEDLGQRMHDAEVELVLVDGHVTPVQQRNLEKAWKVKLLDRTGLILEIFADRARTREGVMQVDLAALSYQRTRLVRAWTHLERQRGGLGFVGGPGETQIEADRRAIDDAIARIKRQLSKVVKTRELHRSARAKVPFPVVALVGYTNAGKSTLFNHVTGASVMAKDMLFATLDPTMRAVELASGQRIILSDTVGFISDLPTQLIAAFRATLEEVMAADLILHVRDISHPDTEEQAEDVRDILQNLGIPREALIFEIWNKIDALPPDARLARVTQAERTDGVFAVSAIKGDGVAGLLSAVSQALDEDRTSQHLVLSSEDGRKRAWLYDQKVVKSERQEDDGIHLDVHWTQRQQTTFRAL